MIKGIRLFAFIISLFSFSNVFSQQNDNGMISDSSAKIDSASSITNTEPVVTRTNIGVTKTLKSASIDTGVALSTDTVAVASVPFAFGDFSWLNGTSRKTSAPAFDSKYFTGDVTFDFNYTHSFNNPIDNTVVGSTALARNNELQLSFMGVGGDIHVGNVRGRVMMQFGTRSTVVPRNDGSSYRGQYDLQTIYRYISEAYVGYHWDVWHGINLDAGIFIEEYD